MNLQILFRLFNVILFLSSDFMVSTNIRNICKQIPRTCFRIIENLQIFFRCFSMISFLSSDFTVPTSICKKIPRTCVRAKFLNLLQIFQCFIQKTIFQCFIYWSPLIFVKTPFSLCYYFSVNISQFPLSLLKEFQNLWQWHGTTTFLPLLFPFFHDFSVGILGFPLSVLKSPQNLCWKLHNYLIIRLYFSLFIFFGLSLMVSTIRVFV